MPPRARLLLLAAAAALTAAQPAMAEADDGDLRGAEAIDFFEQRVRPLLAARCHECHGAKKQEYGLRLDSRAGVLAGSQEGAVVVPGKPDESRLVKAIRYGGEIEMPPGGKLPEEEIAALVRWVELGLPWPQESSRSEPLAGEALYEYSRAKLWSLQPVRRPALPAVKDAAWPRQAIDFFILAKLEEQGLSPSPAADRRTLIRRAAFDLHGLPPTPEEVEAFAADDSPDAYEKVIDRLLASPRYGERWARHWLDVARYADTRGYSIERERRYPFAYTYRDWVIRALNDDLPYDRFVVSQIAADRLPDVDDSQLAALGFLTVGREHSSDHDNIDDQIDAVTRGFLGLTVACARCHDHKYDAIPTADYYSLYGVFASSTAPAEYPLLGTAHNDPEYEKFQGELSTKQAAFDEFVEAKKREIAEVARANATDYLIRTLSNKSEQQLAKLSLVKLKPEEVKQRVLFRWRVFLESRDREQDPVWMPMIRLRYAPDDNFVPRTKGEMQAWKAYPPEKLNPLVRAAFDEKMPTNREELAQLYGKLLQTAYDAWKEAGGNEAAQEKVPPAQRQLLHSLLAEGTPTSLPNEELLNSINRADQIRYRALEKEVVTHMATAPGAPPRAMSLVDRERPQEPHIFIRGDHTRRGDRVPRQFLRVVAGDARQPFRDGSGRLELARAIVDPQNPLTARVIVNRVWMHHFGQPLVATPSDFGMRSDPPTHPALLDWLAVRLLESGWSLKDLHRQIVLSAAYQQDSRLSPPSAAGNPQSVDPENRLLWRMNRRRLEFEALRDSLLAVSGSLDDAMYGRPEELFTNASLRRRSVYGFIDRQDLPSVLRAFDFASPDQSAERRPSTTVPQQALFLLNSPFVLQQVQALATRPEIALQQEPPVRIAALYRAIYQRAPSQEELKAGEEFIRAAIQAGSGDDKLDPWQQYAQLLLAANEFMYVD